MALQIAEGREWNSEQCKRILQTSGNACCEPSTKERSRPKLQRYLPFPPPRSSALNRRFLLPGNQTSCRKNIGGIFVFHQINGLKNAYRIQGYSQNNASDPVEWRGGMILDHPRKEHNRYWQKKKNGSQQAYYLLSEPSRTETKQLQESERR
jgi:hypothetical protein